MQEKLQKHSVVVKERDSAVARDGFARTGIIKGAETISEAACGGVAVPMGQVLAVWRCQCKRNSQRDLVT